MSQQPTANIPNEHLPHVMNSAIAEKLFGFERRVENGQFEWRGLQSNGVMSEWGDRLPAFASDLGDGLDLLLKVSQQTGHGLNVVYSPLQDACVVVILRVSPDGQQVAPLFQVTGRPLPELVAAAVCQLMNLDLAAQHRELFPASYLVLNQ